MAADEHGSPSPQPLQPMTKRDVRRNRITDKLEGLITSFAANGQHHYRAQLQAVQADMNLILRADPYNNDRTAIDPSANGESATLVDTGEGIRELIQKLGAVLPDYEEAQGDYWSMAGAYYRTFAKEVNDSIEHRDSDLVALHSSYQSAISELERLTQQKFHQAEEEHKHLTSTIRQRLVTSITKKRQQLLRDKEQLDIADSNAHLLHPSHYSINNPGSPGGPLGNRKTRHLRHRAGSPSAGELGGDNNKRKRKLGALDDEGNESPAPGFRPLPISDALQHLSAGGRSPFKDARDKNSYIQYEAPAYSLERIFTDKELALATDLARNATYRYFHQPPPPPPAPQGKPSEDNNAANGTGETSLDGADGDGGGIGEESATNTVAETAIAVATPPSGGVEMARETSHQVLTRGGARANPLAALSDLANAAASASVAGPGGFERGDPFAPVIPSYHAVTRSEKSGAPAPPGVGALDVESDLAMMRSMSSQPRGGMPEVRQSADEVEQAAASAEAASAMRRQLLDQALGTAITTQPYRLPLLETGPAIIGKGVDRLITTAFQPALPAEQRLKLQQQSGATAAASSGLGSMAAALQGRFGGEPMSRTTSAGGVSEFGTTEVGGTVTGSGGRRGRGSRFG